MKKEYQAAWEESYGDKWVKKTLARPTVAKCRFWLDSMDGYPSIYRNMRVETRTVTEWGIVPASPPSDRPEQTSEGKSC